MTKAELVEAVAKSAGLKKAEAEKAVGAFISSVSAALKKGDRVTLVGFGSFEVTSKKARTGRNPQTGKEIKIQAARVPKFRPGKDLKAAALRTHGSAKVKCCAGPQGEDDIRPKR